ncbi:MAG: hypothetical protein ABR573_00615 [Candidatus Dormibacteria bacterium]
MAAVILGGVALYLFNNSSVQQVDPSNTPALERALTVVPAQDQPGHDLPQVPRPAGTVRTYFLANAAVSTAVYTRRGSVGDVRPGIEAGLGKAGWGAVGAATPAPASGSQRTWQQVYSDGVRVLQVQVFTHTDTVATIYVLQTSKAGQ